MSFSVLVYGYIVFHVVDSSLGSRVHSGQKPTHCKSTRRHTPPSPCSSCWWFRVLSALILCRALVLHGPLRSVSTLWVLPTASKSSVLFCLLQIYILMLLTDVHIYHCILSSTRRQLEKNTPQRNGQKTFHIQSKVEVQDSVAI